MECLIFRREDGDNKVWCIDKEGSELVVYFGKQSAPLARKVIQARSGSPLELKNRVYLKQQKGYEVINGYLDGDNRFCEMVWSRAEKKLADPEFDLTEVMTGTDAYF